LESRKKPAASGNAEGDLPIEGDATANVQTAPSATTPADLTGPKPWWWWPTFMPLWVYIATTGSRGMNNRLEVFDSEHGPVSLSQEEDGNGEDGNGGATTQVVEPCKRDYIFSIFFIFFGLVAMVAGILSNVYVQVNNIFYTPT
jgi:hypothetical protein